VEVRALKCPAFMVEMELVALQACILTLWTHPRELTSHKIPINSVSEAITLDLMPTLRADLLPSTRERGLKLAADKRLANTFHLLPHLLRLSKQEVRTGKLTQLSQLRSISLLLKTSKTNRLSIEELLTL